MSIHASWLYAGRAFRAGLLGVAALGWVYSGHSADEETTTATKTGGITIYNEKRAGVEGVDVKTGPITTSTIRSPIQQDETLMTATRMGKVTELTGSKGTKSTVVTTGPMTSGQVNGKGISVLRIGEKVAIGKDENGGSMKAIQVGNQIVVERSGTATPSDVRIMVHAMQEPVAAGQLAGTGTNDVSLIPFTGVNASGDVAVDVECGLAFEILVASPKMREYTVFEVVNNVLQIRCVGTRPGERISRKVVVKLPRLSEVTACEGAQLAVRNVSGERCVVVCRGSSKVEISGKVDAVQCRGSGGSQVLGQQLFATRMAARLDGDGVIHCRAEQELVVVITGKGTIWSHGQPRLVTRKITGGGELKFEK